MPHLPTVAEQTSSIGLADCPSSRNGEGDEVNAVGKWEDEEERRFYEDIPDLKDFVPKSVLGIDGTSIDPAAVQKGVANEDEARKRQEENDIMRLEAEMEHLKVGPLSSAEDEAE
jgi:regulator of nonsense transcripts 2